MRKQTLRFIESFTVVNDYRHGLFETNNNNDNNNIISLSFSLIFTNHFDTYNFIDRHNNTSWDRQKCIFPLYKKQIRWSEVVYIAQINTAKKGGI